MSNESERVDTVMVDQVPSSRGDRIDDRVCNTTCCGLRHLIGIQTCLGMLDDDLVLVNDCEQ